MGEHKGSYEIEKLENGLYLARNQKQPAGLFNIQRPWVFYANPGDAKTGGYIRTHQRRPEDSRLMYLVHDSNPPLYEVVSFLGLFNSQTGTLDHIGDEILRKVLLAHLAEQGEAHNLIARFAPWSFSPTISSEVEGLEAALTGMKLQDAMKILREKAGLVQGSE